MAHGLSCSVACGIFPDQGPNPCPLHWQVDSQPLCHQRCPYISDFIYLNLIYFISLAKALPILIKKKKKKTLKKLIYLFWLQWVFVAACRLFLVLVTGGYSLLWCMGFLLWWLPLLWSMGSRHVVFSSCGTWTLELRLSSCGSQAQFALWHVGSYQTRAQTCVPCIVRQILNHCTTREVPKQSF